MQAPASTVPRVLLVDDTPANLVALGAVLRPLGVELVEARSGSEAIDKAASGSFAVALLDVQMPAMDGFEAAARIRATDGGRHLPIIFLTAIARDEGYARRGYAAGAADYITKPYDADVLRARVKAFVDLFRQREELRQRDVEDRTRERDEAVRRLAALERIATAALEEGEIAAFLRKLLGVFLEAADSADSAAIFLLESGVLQVKASVGGSGPAVGDTVAVDNGFAGTIATVKEPRFVSNGTDSSVAGEPHRFGCRGLFGIPLLHDGETIGVAQIGSTKDAEFSDAEKRLFTAMAERAAWAVAQRARLDRFHAVLMAAPAIVSILRVPGYSREFANLACRQLFCGRELLGEADIELGKTPEILAMLDRVAAGGESLSRTEHRVSADWKGNGAVQERFFNFTLQPMRGPRGVVEAVLAFSIDVTSQVQAREELEKAIRARAALLQSERAARAEAEVANRAKDDFLATVSHELRTPLNAILGWTVIAQRTATPDLKRALDVIERNARSQARIIEDVLDVSRIIGGKLRLMLSSVDVVAVVERALEAARPAAEAKGVSLSASLSNLGVIMADAERLQQVIGNILSNAIKFTPSGGAIGVTSTRAGSRIVLRISDTGEGIASAFLPRLFEPFQQADGSTTRRHGGLGLGLAIVKQLVAAHGGTVVAESDGANKGSTFSIVLPGDSSHSVFRDSRPPPARGGASLRELARLDGVVVLVVDDEKDARDMLLEILSACGATVECANGACEALERVRDLKPQVVVSDLGMPEMDGLDLIRQIRRLSVEQGGRTPAIALTAYAHSDDAGRALSAGFQMHLAKPVDPATLASAIASLASMPADASAATTRERTAAPIAHPSARQGVGADVAEGPPRER
jgi:signal transduction histidine kinase/CheY-like chemotaxis protein